MKVDYSIKEPQDVNQAVLEAATERPGEGIRLRVQPGIFRAGKAGRSSTYMAWRGVYWGVECQDVDEAIALRETLRLAFDLIGRLGVAPVRDQLALLQP